MIIACVRHCSSCASEQDGGPLCLSPSVVTSVGIQNRGGVNLAPIFCQEELHILNRAWQLVKLHAKYCVEELNSSWPCSASLFRCNKLERLIRSRCRPKAIKTCKRGDFFSPQHLISENVASEGGIGNDPGVRLGVQWWIEKAAAFRRIQVGKPTVYV